MRLVRVARENLVNNYILQERLLPLNHSLKKKTEILIMKLLIQSTEIIEKVIWGHGSTEPRDQIIVYVPAR